jgi:hypothetical protein
LGAINENSMGTIKQNLISTFTSENISNLVEYTATKYRPYDPGQYLYKLAMEFPNERKFTEKFIELTYTTLIAWNMNQRGAKLSEYEIFKNSLIEHKERIRSLERFRIEKNLDGRELTNEIEFLFKNLKLVSIDKPKLVTFSKTLHFFLPNLLMPIDRSYTLHFFYNSTNVPKDDVKQIIIYNDILNQFRQLSEVYNFKIHLDRNWNRNIPKIIDNIIIAYIQKQR